MAVVQNGIIENHRALREQLEASGVVFQSETDTEVIPHLLAAELQQLQAAGGTPCGELLLAALQQVLPKLEGAYALAVIWDQAPGALVVARKAAPLLIGLGGRGIPLCQRYAGPGGIHPHDPADGRRRGGLALTPRR